LPKPQSTAKAKWAVRKRNAALRRKRERRLRAERQNALNDPGHAAVRAAAVSIRDFKVMTGLSHASIFRRLRDGSLRSIKLAGRRLISASEIERLRGE
jgi:hypothetical protein